MWAYILHQSHWILIVRFKGPCSFLVTYSLYFEKSYFKGSTRFRRLCCEYTQYRYLGPVGDVLFFSFEYSIDPPDVVYVTCTNCQHNNNNKSSHSHIVFTRISCFQLCDNGFLTDRFYRNLVTISLVQGPNNKDTVSKYRIYMRYLYVYGRSHVSTAQHTMFVCTHTV